MRGLRDRVAARMVGLVRLDCGEAQRLIDATEAFTDEGDGGLLRWIQAAGDERERELRRRAGLVVKSVEADHPELMQPVTAATPAT